MKEQLKGLLQPFHVLNKKAMISLIVVETVIVLAAWQLAGKGLIPRPSDILSSFGNMMSGTQGDEFLDNLFRSLSITIQGMGISLIIALFISYLSLIPLFNPIANFIIKCRYLTLAGLNFTFIVFTNNPYQLKISLLIFGIVPFFVTSFMSILDGINTQEYDLCKTLRMNNWQTMWEVVIVGRLDQAIEVMRQNFAISWMMITTVEGLNMGGGGLGTMFVKFTRFIEQGNLYVLLVVIFFLGIFFDYILGQIRHWLFPYTKLHVRK
jgi:NitT/TauT family transport system permease protein